MTMVWVMHVIVVLFLSWLFNYLVINWLESDMKSLNFIGNKIMNKKTQHCQNSSKIIALHTNTSPYKNTALSEHF
jgi:hypothetical protein